LGDGTSPAATVDQGSNSCVYSYWLAPT